MIEKIAKALFGVYEPEHVSGTPRIVYTEGNHYMLHKNITIFLNNGNQIVYASGSPSKIESLADVVRSCITRGKSVSLLGNYDHGRFVFTEANADGYEVKLK